MCRINQSPLHRHFIAIASASTAAACNCCQHKPCKAIIAAGIWVQSQAHAVNHIHLLARYWCISRGDKEGQLVVHKVGVNFPEAFKDDLSQAWIDGRAPAEINERVGDEGCTDTHTHIHMRARTHTHKPNFTFHALVQVSFPLLPPLASFILHLKAQQLKQCHWQAAAR